jgi:hypothetical protein
VKNGIVTIIIKIPLYFYYRDLLLIHNPYFKSLYLFFTVGLHKLNNNSVYMSL